MKWYICYIDENECPLQIHDYGKAPRDTEEEAEDDLRYWQSIGHCQDGFVCPL